MFPFVRFAFGLLLGLAVQFAHAYDAVDIALEKVGKEFPYVLAAAGPTEFDCSGLVQYAFAHVGIGLPKLAREQSLLGEPVTQSFTNVALLRRGDLMFFANSRSEADQRVVGHVAIYIGNGQWVNAEGWRGHVLVDDFGTVDKPNSFYRYVFLEARRLPASPGPSSKFVLGDSVTVAENDVNIRGSTDWVSYVLQSSHIGKSVAGTVGRISSSRPIYAKGNWFWQVDFESGDDGWVAEEFLKKFESGVPSTFFDDFNRPDGPVGNAWTDMTDNVNGSLTITQNRLTTPNPNGRAGIYRSLSPTTGSVTVSAAITQGNGFYGYLLNRYSTSLLFGNSGNSISGYGVYFARSDSNFNNSSIYLTLNGTQVGVIPLPGDMQFGSSIRVSVTYNPLDGSINGSVVLESTTFAFAFPALPSGRLAALPGTYFGLVQEFPGGQLPPLTMPTIDDLTIAISP